jgi:hypothetical protein
MIFGRVLCCPLWPSCGWYCHGEESRSYGAFLDTFGDNSESILMAIYMYPSKYECGNRWKLNHILKYGSKWIVICVLVETKSMHEYGIQFNLWIEWLIICTRKGVNDYDFIPLEKENYESRHALQVIPITCWMWFAETAGSVGIKLLEEGVIPRVPKLRARNKSRIRDG